MNIILAEKNQEIKTKHTNYKLEDKLQIGVHLRYASKD